VKVSEPSQSQIAQESLKTSASHLTQEQQDLRKKYNLNTWKYAELRDTINTSVGRSPGTHNCFTSPAKLLVLMALLVF